jgi:hypothetical protein
LPPPFSAISTRKSIHLSDPSQNKSHSRWWDSHVS